MPISLSTPEWSWATLFSNVSYIDSECCQLFHSPMELLSCATCSEFSVDTLLSRRLDPLSGREPPEVSSNPNHSTNVWSTISVADTSQDYRGQQATLSWWLQRLCVLHAGKDVMAMAMTAVLYWTGLLWNPGCHSNGHRDVQDTFDKASVKYNNFQAVFLQAMAFQILLLQNCY